MWFNTESSTRGWFSANVASGKGLSSSASVGAYAALDYRSWEPNPSSLVSVAAISPKILAYPQARSARHEEFSFLCCLSSFPHFDLGNSQPPFRVQLSCAFQSKQRAASRELIVVCSGASVAAEHLLANPARLGDSSLLVLMEFTKRHVDLYRNAGTSV